MSKVKTREPAGIRADRSAINRSPTLLEHYGCGPVKFTGTSDALYERHLLFDAVIAPSAAGARTLRGAGPVRARRPLAALGPHQGDL